jgi:ABC-type Fe3+/spermidine/putrescine transport system ATPase subunit
MIAGLEVPDGGRVVLGDDEITYLPPYRRNIGMVFQDYALFPHMTVKDNVAFGLQMRKVASEEIDGMVTKALEMVHLGGLGGRKPGQLSGGQQQRVALARSLVIEPELLLLDEPLSNLDAKLRAEMRVELGLIQREVGITTLFVTHDQEEALTLSDRIVVMREGRIVQMGSPYEIYEGPTDDFVASFLGQENFFRGEVVAAEGERFQIKASDGLLIWSSCVGSGQTAIGQEALVVIKKERIRISSTETPGAENSFPAKVEFVTYLGPIINYLCSIGTQKVVINIQNEAGVPAFQRGDSVQLEWDSDDCISVDQSGD